MTPVKGAAKTRNGNLKQHTMIIGTGDIASILSNRDDVTFFASGVSNSSCSDPGKFKRESDLLKTMPRHVHLVYFSSLSIYYSHNPYVAHKRRMELLVKDLFNSYTIVRIGNISWGKNPNTLINYLKAHPEAQILPVWRHIIDEPEFRYWMEKILVGERNEMNVPGEWVWVPQLATELSLGKIFKGSAYKVYGSGNPQ